MYLSQRSLLDYMRRDRAFLRGLSTTETRRRYRAVMGFAAITGMSRAAMRTSILRARYEHDIWAKEEIYG